MTLEVVVVIEQSDAIIVLIAMLRSNLEMIFVVDNIGCIHKDRMHL